MMDRRAWSCGLLIGMAFVLGCVPLPVQPTPAVEGRIVDAETGDPLASAIVVVRFDVRRGELLPERDLIGHREAVSDATGRFRVARGVVPGVGSWPRPGMEARIVSVMTETHRCPRPRRFPNSGGLTLRLEAAVDAADLRDSCRPVAARPDEAPLYLAAWRALYPRRLTANEHASARQVDELLVARAAFGAGENCTGPAVDLALSPSGNHVALSLESTRGRSVEVIALSSELKRLARVRAEEPGPTPALRLAWSSDAQLVLWDPARSTGRSPDGVGASRVLWADPTSEAPAAASPDTAPPSRPLDLSDLNDEGDARWQGRSFRIERRVDPETGLATESLRVMELGGQKRSLALPGLACGPRGQFGRPHFRISADGRRGHDLRWVQGGCRAISIDLADGDWQALSSNRGTGLCRESRRVPLPHLRRAVRGYVQEIEDALIDADGDPSSAYTLEIADDGSTQISARDYLGGRLTLPVSPFPVTTPLRRIHVSTVTAQSGAPPAVEPAAIPQGLEPL